MFGPVIYCVRGTTFVNYSFSDPSCGLNRYNNWVPQGCFPGAGDLNRRLARPADCTVQSNVWCEPEPRRGIGILGVFAALAGIAVVATVLRKPSEDITIVKHTKKSVASVPAPAAPAITDPNKDKKDPITKPTLKRPAAAASREDKHAWLTANKVDHKYGHLNYSKFDMGTAPHTKITDGASTFELQTDAANAYMEMANAAKAAGITLKLNSAYRSNTDQKKEWDAKVAENQKNGLSTDPDEISKTVAPEGHSEHSTGYAVDFDLSPNGKYDKPTDDWLKANAARYGFVNSFTEGNSQGVNPEAWHWRFEGNAAYPDKSGGAAKAFKAAHELEALK